jgi:hypothetical protein
MEESVERNKYFKTTSLTDIIRENLWSIPMPEVVLKDLGFRNLYKHSYSNSYKAEVFYFSYEANNKYRICGFIQEENNLLFPNDYCYKQVSDGGYFNEKR